MKTRLASFMCAAALTLLFATTANAHLCILKHGSYNLNDPYVCDAGDGSRIIDLTFYTADAEIELDVVFQQDPIDKKRLDAYQAAIDFDSRMGQPEGCNCHDRRSSISAPSPGTKCDSDDPTIVCQNYPVIWNNISSIMTVDLIDDFITDYPYKKQIKICVGSLQGSTQPTNQLMQTLVFKNIFNEEGEGVYTFGFADEFDTMVLDSDWCDLLADDCGVQAKHKAMSSRINIERACNASRPTLIEATCVADAECEQSGHGEATVRIEFGVPAGCVSSSGNPHPECEGRAVRIVPTFEGGGAAVVPAGSPFVTRVPVPSTVSYDLVGLSSSCYPSLSPHVSTGQIQCSCNPSPPKQAEWRPAKNSVLSTLSPVVNLQTNEEAWCRWSLYDYSYDEMADDCDRLPESANWHRCDAKGLSESLGDVYIACRDAFDNKDTSASNEKIGYQIEYCVLHPEECSIQVVVNGSFTKYEVVECDAGTLGCLVANGESRGFKKRERAFKDIVVELFESESTETSLQRITDDNGEIGSFRMRPGSCVGCVESSKKYGVRARIPADGWDESTRSLVGCDEDSTSTECFATIMKATAMTDMTEIIASSVSVPDFENGAGGGDIGNPTCRQVVHMANLNPLKYRFGAQQGDEKYHPAVDFNMDGRITMQDLAVLKKNYGKSVTVSANTKLCDPLFDAR